MEKKFCDLCGKEIVLKDEPNAFENNIYIRVERDDKKFEIQDACDDCITEFRQTFSKFIKEKNDN
ncbi:MAG TPA: hypothetical protein VMZ91_10200 [Candidatus Paceibacterota bacterium]|nr:hypothetical protein [Candidatus Paceibacterota bacterium]